MIHFELKRCAVAVALSATLTMHVQAAEYLSIVTSEVIPAQGSARDIAARGRICISQHLASGIVGGELIVNADLEAGIVVANSAIEYGSMPRWKIRSRFTFEARDGRFRIQQTNLERFNDQFNVGWNPIGKWTGSQWKGAEAAFSSSASLVAQCVATGPIKENW